MKAARIASASWCLRWDGQHSSVRLELTRPDDAGRVFCGELEVHGLAELGRIMRAVVDVSSAWRELSVYGQHVKLVVRRPEKDGRLLFAIVAPGCGYMPDFPFELAGELLELLELFHKLRGPSCACERA